MRLLARKIHSTRKTTHLTVYNACFPTCTHAPNPPIQIGEGTIVLSVCFVRFWQGRSALFKGVHHTGMDVRMPAERVPSPLKIRDCHYAGGPVQSVF